MGEASTNNHHLINLVKDTMSHDLIRGSHDERSRDLKKDMNYPPDVNGLFHFVFVARKPVNSLGNQNGQFFGSSNPECL